MNGVLKVTEILPRTQQEMKKLDQFPLDAYSFSSSSKNKLSDIDLMLQKLWKLSFFFLMLHVPIFVTGVQSSYLSESNVDIMSAKQYITWLNKESLQFVNCRQLLNGEHRIQDSVSVTSNVIGIFKTNMVKSSLKSWHSKVANLAVMWKIFQDI